MSKADKFESLKANALKNYSDYINKIKKFSFEDLKDINNRLDLLDAYNKSVLSNSPYGVFVNENIRSLMKNLNK